jgi:L-ascorbate metabolism protein UlaG (beta-lactamase superfamily)
MKNVKLFLRLVPILLLIFSIPLYADEIGKGVKVTFFGHSAFKIVSPKDVVINIDPYLSKNPKTPAEMKTVEKADLILVTHGHMDHVGDTGVFGDMKILGEIYKPELSLLPIGSHFTMDPKEATYAAKLLGSKYVIPMHYGTFPVLTDTPEDFLKLMKEVP